MKIEDLRIGNIIFSEYNEPFTKVDLEFLNTFDMVKCWGVPIDEKILLQCGGYKNHPLEWDLNGLMIVQNEYRFFLAYDYDNGRNAHSIVSDIIYLHELQNLYYALTKKELEIDINKLEL